MSLTHVRSFLPHINLATKYASEKIKIIATISFFCKLLKAFSRQLYQWIDFSNAYSRCPRASRWVCAFLIAKSESWHFLVINQCLDVSHLAQQQPSGYQYGGSANTNGNGNGGDSSYNGGGSSNDLGEGFEESSIFNGFSSYDAPLVSGSNFDNGANAAQNVDVRLQGDYASSGASASAYGSNGNGNDVNLVQGQSKSIDLTGGSPGGKRIVYKPVIKQGEPIITKNFYVVSATSCC